LAARTLRRASREADVVLVNGLLALPAIRVARSRVPVVWLVHDVLRRADRLAIARWAAPAVDLAIAVSKATAGPVRDIGIETVVVPNGTAWPVDPAPQPPPQPPVVGCAAALTPWKGQDVLLEAARLLPPEVTIELAGGTFPKDGPFVDRLHQLAAQPGLEGRVRLLGRISDPLARMRQWTVCVSSSIDPEAGPLHVIEAMSVGVPVVGTDHGGTAEAVGEAGLLVPPGDPAALAAAITRLLTDDDLRRRCAAAGPRLIAEHYQLNDRVNELLDVIAGVEAEAKS
jgi:glycosyltransferase involved in cell wall biosynthesis